MKKQNDEIIATSFSQLGSQVLAKLLTKKYGCTIIKESTYDEKIGMWILTYKDPTLEKMNDSSSNKKTKNRRTKISPI